jgi:F0F1-type ATP synthase assembly protein I
MTTKKPEPGSETQKKESLRGAYSELGPLLGVGVQLALTMVLMVFLGRWLDEKYNRQPLFLIICSVVGLTAGMYNMIKTVNDFEKKDKK